MLELHLGACQGDAVAMLETTGCDAVMIGRAAMGNPFIFKAVNDAIAGLPPADIPTVTQRMELLRRHVIGLCTEKGEYRDFR